jgi:hypothetical protein
MPTRLLTRLALLVAAVLTGAQTAPRLLATEPGRGELREGETVLVDDGSCPRGQIKLVVGGSNMGYRTDGRRAGMRREVSCVARR